MTNETQLSALVADLADEELLRRLHSGSLTAMAADVVQRELSSRGISALPSADARVVPAPHAQRRAAAEPRRFRSILTRVLFFPLRAVQGTAPLWSVFVFGLLVLAAVFASCIAAVQHLLFPLRVTQDVLNLADALMGLYALTAVWFGVALWRTGSRSPSQGVRVAMRIVAAVLAVNCVLGALSAARFAQNRLLPDYDGPSIMDSAPR